jgi:hypothetical protein
VHAVQHWVSSAWHAVESAVSAVWDWVANLVSEVVAAVEQVASAAASAWNGGTQALGRAWNSGTQAAGRAWNSATGGGGSGSSPPVPFWQAPAWVAARAQAVQQWATERVALAASMPHRAGAGVAQVAQAFVGAAQMVAPPAGPGCCTTYGEPRGPITEILTTLESGLRCCTTPVEPRGPYIGIHISPPGIWQCCSDPFSPPRILTVYDQQDPGTATSTARGGTRLSDDRIQEPPTSRGRPPIGDDSFPIELHHRDQQPTGPLDEMTRTDHRGTGNFGANHPNTGQSPSLIDRAEFAKERLEHWASEWDSGRWSRWGI